MVLRGDPNRNFTLKMYLKLLMILERDTLKWDNLNMIVEEEHLLFQEEYAIIVGMELLKLGRLVMTETR